MRTQFSLQLLSIQCCCWNQIFLPNQLVIVIHSSIWWHSVVTHLFLKGISIGIIWSSLLKCSSFCMHVCAEYTHNLPTHFLWVTLQVSWSPDSSKLISASGDKTVKLWDMGTSTALTTFNMGADVMDQQLGCLWQKDHLLSISLSGYINYLDKNNPDRPLRTIKVRLNSFKNSWGWGWISHFRNRPKNFWFSVVWLVLRLTW